MTNKLAAMAFGAFVACVSLGAATSADAAIVNISAVDSTLLTPTTFTFDPGQYLIQFAGVAGGGLYDGYNLNCANGCPASGWTNSFALTTSSDPNPDIDLYNLPGGPAPTFASAAAALAAFKAAPFLIDVTLAYNPSLSIYQPQLPADIVTQPWIVTLNQQLTVKFFIPESGSRADNVGGVSLSITAVPEPQAWALMILGFAAAGAGLRRRRALAQG